MSNFDRHLAQAKKDELIRRAAKDLLEALKSAIKTAEFENHPFRAWHADARAAIAKAEGKS